MEISIKEIKNYLENSTAQLENFLNLDNQSSSLPLKSSNIKFKKRFTESRTYIDVTISKDKIQPIFLTTYQIDANKTNVATDILKVVDTELKTLMFF